MADKKKGLPEALEGLTRMIRAACYALYGGVGPASDHIKGVGRTRLYDRMKSPDELTLAELRAIRTSLQMDKAQLLEQIGKVI